MAPRSISAIYARAEAYGTVFHVLAGLLAGAWLWCGLHGVVAAVLNWLAFNAYQIHDDKRPVYEYAEWLAGLAVGFTGGWIVVSVLGWPAC